jgi:nucleotide-binding universal stress UspA family protein
VPFRSVLCAVDFSEHSEQALRWAVALASRYRAALTVLTAVDPILAAAARARFQMDLAASDATPALDELVSRAVPEGASWAPPVTTEVRVGDAHDVILDAAGRRSADLVVMGTQGLGAVQRALIGSTAERVLRRATVAVLAVPLAERPGVTLETAGPAFAVDRVLAATDFSSASAAALAQAADLATHIGAPLTLLHAVPPPTAPFRWQRYLEETESERINEARSRLGELKAQVSAPVPDIVVTPGRPADVIASTARERRAGLIVLGLTGGGTPHGRPGSIAYRVLGLAHVPVMVVPATA